MKALNAINYGEIPFPHNHAAIIYIRLAAVVLQHNPPQALTIINQGLDDYPGKAKIWM